MSKIPRLHPPGGKAVTMKGFGTNHYCQDPADRCSEGSAPALGAPVTSHFDYRGSLSSHFGYTSFFS